MDKYEVDGYEYSSVSNSDETLGMLESHSPPDAEEKLYRRQGWIRGGILAAIIAGGFVITTIAGFYLGNYTAANSNWKESEKSEPHSQMTHPGVLDEMVRITDCGASPAEAKALNCKFDVMLQRWIPEDCYDEAHSELFLAKYPRKWYYDMDLKHEMDDATVMVRGGEHQMTFTPSDYHKRHCSYTWELTSRALQEQRPLLDELISFEHTHHCNGILLGPEWNETKFDGHSKPTEVDPGYLRCASYTVWLQDMPA
ncbi:hypothetical protein F4777DRAFT_594102 [Nemania sp. FL0916]|nr:hypothetical protein F4777DRAFT_594102 [Nemania sp. FL0916]